jgi:predicted DNA-binding protein (UPF0251 family)
MRLVDIEGFAQQDAASAMKISRQTFSNIIKMAKYKVDHVLVNGYALVLRDKNENKESDGKFKLQKLGK